MSQEKPTRPAADKEPVKYGDVLPVSGQLVSEPVAPKDAATVQTAETKAIGHVQKGGPAAVMQSAATENVKRGVLHRDDVSETMRQHGFSISTAEEPHGEPLVTETVGGEVLGKFVVVAEDDKAEPPLSEVSPVEVTIGQALESVLKFAGDKVVDECDAAALQAVESRATGLDEVVPGGVASAAQHAATHNARTMAENKKIKLRDVLAGAASKLPKDKVVTKEDAEAAVAAELRNSPTMRTYPGGVAASMRRGLISRGKCVVLWILI